MRQPPRSRIDARRAVDIYVAGRARNIPVEDKILRVLREVESPTSDPEPADTLPNRPARYGVSVPEELDFHRGAGTWRERIGSAAHPLAP